jgi:sarcosine oxidase subunit beta
MTIFADDGFHLRVRDGRVLLLMPWDFPEQNLEFDPVWLPHVLERAHARVPALRDVAIAHGWAGLYEMSPDGHALLGRHPRFENLYLCNGSSGHGVMHSPALGQVLSEIILDGRASSLDVRSLRPERFLEGDAIQGNSLL